MLAGETPMSSYENAFEAKPGLVARGVEDRQNLMRKETEDFLRAVSEDYPSRAGEYWQRDYSSVEAYLASVEPNRQRWLEAVGDFGPPEEDMDPLFEPFAENEHFTAQWVTINLYDGLRGRGVLAIPKRAQPPYPLIISQHGIGSSPETVFGFKDDSFLYHSYGQRAVEAGFAVLLPWWGKIAPAGFMVAYSIARFRIVAAGTPVMASAQAGVFSTPSSMPRT
jgi:hypothetical protein